MKKSLLPIILATVFVGAGFVSVGPAMQLLEGKLEQDVPAATYATVKSEFISVSVFESGVVKGYFSFRMEFEIADVNRLAEITYRVSDFMFRRNIPYEDIERSEVNFVNSIEKSIRTVINNAFENNLVKELEIVDSSFDLRL